VQAHRRDLHEEDRCGEAFAEIRVQPLHAGGEGEAGRWMGVAWYIDGFPRVVKSEKPVYEEAKAFEKAIKSISSSILIAHVRKASNPRNLPRNMIIGLKETQPFHHGKRIFAHNGVIRVPDDAMKLLGEYKTLVRGE